MRLDTRGRERGRGREQAWRRGACLLQRRRPRRRRRWRRLARLQNKLRDRSRRRKRGHRRRQPAWRERGRGRRRRAAEQPAHRLAIQEVQRLKRKRDEGAQPARASERNDAEDEACGNLGEHLKKPERVRDPRPDGRESAPRRARERVAPAARPRRRASARGAAKAMACARGVRRTRQARRSLPSERARARPTGRAETLPRSPSIS